MQSSSIAASATVVPTAVAGRTQSGKPGTPKANQQTMTAYAYSVCRHACVIEVASRHLFSSTWPLKLFDWLQCSTWPLKGDWHLLCNGRNSRLGEELPGLLHPRHCQDLPSMRMVVRCPELRPVPPKQQRLHQHGCRNEERDWVVNKSIWIPSMTQRKETVDAVSPLGAFGIRFTAGHCRVLKRVH